MRAQADDRRINGLSVAGLAGSQHKNVTSQTPLPSPQRHHKIRGLRKQDDQTGFWTGSRIQRELRADAGLI
jgi:hypothetical protein